MPWSSPGCPFDRRTLVAYTYVMTLEQMVPSLKFFRRALALSVFVAGAVAAAPPVDENELLAVGFKVLVAKTTVQEDWVKTLPPGQIRPMQRTGKKYFIYPDAARKQIYVGGPEQYAAYQQLHPDAKLSAREAAAQGRAYRLKQDDAMKKATARDLSDPYYGVDWSDLGW
jgi:hypothetical protein